MPNPNTLRFGVKIIIYTMNSNQGRRKSPRIWNCSGLFMGRGKPEIPVEMGMQVCLSFSISLPMYVEKPPHLSGEGYGSLLICQVKGMEY